MVIWKPRKLRPPLTTQLIPIWLFFFSLTFPYFRNQKFPFPLFYFLQFSHQPNRGLRITIHFIIHKHIPKIKIKNKFRKFDPLINLDFSKNASIFLKNIPMENKREQFSEKKIVATQFNAPKKNLEIDDQDENKMYLKGWNRSCNRSEKRENKKFKLRFGRFWWIFLLFFLSFIIDPVSAL